MPKPSIPENLNLLHTGEETVRDRSVLVIESDSRLLMHIGITETVMDMLDMLRQVPTTDEDFKVVQMLGLRLFNAFAASIKLMFAGYYQNSTLLMRDILETLFLVDLFRTDRKAITQWRLADNKARWQNFKPARVREVLDKRDGFTGKKRADVYALFSGLAGHPSMESVLMLRPKGMDAHNGPFFDPTALQATLSEMGRLAVQVGEVINPFFSDDWQKADVSRETFLSEKVKWLSTFYPKPSANTANEA